jgi:hypothetical protein
MALAVRTLGAATIAAASGGGNLSPFKVQIPKPIATREGPAQAADAADRRFNDTSAGPGRAVCVQARRPHWVSYLAASHSLAAISAMSSHNR